MEICRLCLVEVEKPDVISLLSNINIVEQIKNSLSIEITDDDELPTTVCQTCLKKIEEWCIFREKCLNSHNILLERKYNKISNNQIGDFEVENSHHLNIYICEICKEEFDNCVEYLDHQSFHNGQPVFNCDKCHQIFSSRNDLVKHDKNHKISCPKCGKMILKNSMKLHLIKHTDRHMCSECSSRFNSRAALQQHFITIHTDKKNHICENCGKRFSSKTAMTVHLKSHSNERLYRCKICDYAGRTASALYVHMSTHSNEICVCEVCSKTFKSHKNLTDHLRRVHSKEKKHQCSYCDKKFVDKYMLTVHVRCHTGVRPYVCKLCSKAFIRSDGLKEHLVTHGNRTWFCCEKCGKRFASKKGITRHNCTIVTNL